MAWTVGDVMTKEVVTVGPETDFKTCVDLLRTRGVSALPVVDGDYVLGIVSEHDLLLKEEGRGSGAQLRRRELSQARGRTAGDVMHSPALCVGLGASLAEAARLMHKRAIKRLLVLEATGRLVGIVSRSEELETKSLADLVSRLVGSVEGVVGVDSRLAFRLDDSHVKPELPPNALRLSASERQS
jgi:CBS domain-containing protein